MRPAFLWARSGWPCDDVRRLQRHSRPGRFATPPIRPNATLLEKRMRNRGALLCWALVALSVDGHAANPSEAQSAAARVQVQLAASPGSGREAETRSRLELRSDSDPAQSWAVAVGATGTRRVPVPSARSLSAHRGRCRFSLRGGVGRAGHARVRARQAGWGTSDPRGSAHDSVAPGWLWHPVRIRWRCACCLRAAVSGG